MKKTMMTCLILLTMSSLFAEEAKIGKFYEIGKVEVPKENQAYPVVEMGKAIIAKDYEKAKTFCSPEYLEYAERKFSLGFVGNLKDDWNTKRDTTKPMRFKIYLDKDGIKNVILAVWNKKGSTVRHYKTVKVNGEWKIKSPENVKAPKSNPSINTPVKDVFKRADVINDLQIIRQAFKKFYAQKTDKTLKDSIKEYAFKLDVDTGKYLYLGKAGDKFSGKRIPLICQKINPSNKMHVVMYQDSYFKELEGSFRNMAEVFAVLKLDARKAAVKEIADAIMTYHVDNSNEIDMKAKLADYKLKINKNLTNYVYLGNKEDFFMGAPTVAVICEKPDPNKKSIFIAYQDGSAKEFKGTFKTIEDVKKVLKKKN